MLQQIVIYDRFTASLRSKTFKSSHMAIDLDYLAHLPPSPTRNSPQNILFEFQRHFYVDISTSKDDTRLLKKAVPAKIRPGLMRSIQEQSGLFYHDMGMATVNSYRQAMFNLAPLLQRFEARKLQKQQEFEVARLYFLRNLKKKDICVRLGMTWNRLEKIIRRFSYRSMNYLNHHTARLTSPEWILLKHVGQLMRYLRRSSFRMKSLRQQWTLLRGRIDDLERVGFNAYSRFIKEKLGFRYRQFERAYKDPDTKKLLKMRKYIALTLAKLAKRDCLIIFFDSSSVSDGSFKRHMWTLNSQGKTQVNLKKVYGYVNLFMATSFDRILNYWICKSVNSVTTASFLYETIRYCRHTLGYKKIVVFMDNARIHKTALMKRLAETLQVYFLLNAPYSSKINQVEYLFERIKRPFRRRNDKGSWIGLARLLRNRMIEIDQIPLTHETRRFWRFMVQAVHKKKFWTRNN